MTDDPDRDRRTGAYLLQMARSLGWKDDGEGALEFMLRRTREVAIEDCKEPAVTETCIDCGKRSPCDDDCPNSP